MKLKFTASIRDNHTSNRHLAIFVSTDYIETNCAPLPMGSARMPVEEVPVELVQGGVDCKYTPGVINLNNIDWDHEFLAPLKHAALMDLLVSLKRIDAVLDDAMDYVSSIVGTPLFTDEVA